MGWLRRLLLLEEEPEVPEPARTSVAGALACFLLLIDHSGSMRRKDFSPSRILAAVNAGRAVTDYLFKVAPSSLIGVGTFADRFHCCTQPVEVGSSADRIRSSLQNLGKSGATEMARGLAGIHKMLKCCPPQSRRVVMMPDGQNTGRNPLPEAGRIKEGGAEFWAIGIGGSPDAVDEELLRKMVSEPSQYSFIGNWEGPDALAASMVRIARLTLIED